VTAGVLDLAPPARNCPDVNGTAASCDLLTDLDEIRERIRAVTAAKKPVAIDVETGYLGDTREGASLHPEENFVVSVQFTNSLSWGRMIPLGFDSGRNVDNKAVAPLLWEMLHAADDEGLPLGVAHGAIAELRWLARWFLRNLWDHPLFGRQVRESRGYYPVRSCSMLESYAEGKNKSHALKASTLANFGHKMRELVEGADSLLGRLLGRTPTKAEEDSVRFNVFDPGDPEVIAYACEDVVWCLRHHLDRWPRVKDTFIYKVEMNVLPVVCAMSDVGIRYDWNLMRAKSAEAGEFADRLLAEIIEDFEEMTGEKLPPAFNFNSSAQFGDLLYGKCKMPVLHRTPGGKPSVDAKNALPGLAKDYPVVGKYMGWKRLIDLRAKFLDIYEGKYSWAADGRAHPSLLQHGTIGGRFACESPNYQQSPGIYHYELRDGTAFDFNFRDVIAATLPGARNWWDLVLEEAGCTDLPEPDEQGWYFLGFDYSQIELRVMAAEAGETALLEAFASGQDVHSRTAALMLGIAVEQVSDKDRKIGKTRNFASVYGQGIRALADQLGLTIEQAQEKDAQYNAAYPHMQPYRRKAIARARRDGYVITKFGRRITLHQIRDENPKIRAKEEMTAGNAVIQGPATGDYVKVAMVRAVRALDKAGLADRVRMVMNVHDALMFEVRKDVPPIEVIRVLQPAVAYPVTGPGEPWPEMVAEWHIGGSWGSVKDIHTEDGQIVLGKKDKCPRCHVAIEPEPVAVPEITPEARRETDRGWAERESLKWSWANKGVPVPEPGPPRKVVVVARDTPTRDQVTKLAEFMRQLPGQNTVELQMPDGSVPVRFPCGLSPAYESYVAVILGGAAVHYEADSADLRELADGLEL
jgi:DNA polymerase I-like protein with 3'-5' exonuclease and polymerase domains